MYSTHVIIERIEKKIENKVHALVTFKKYNEVGMLLEELHNLLHEFEAKVKKKLDEY